MFTGIIEEVGKIEAITWQEENVEFWVKCSFASDVKIDQSISHNGVCLTVTEVADDQYKVIAVKETLEKSNLGELKRDQCINLERCLKIGDRLDGHLVQGHVDSITKCLQTITNKGSWEFYFNTPSEANDLIVSKGSICINGVSLTLASIKDDQFSVAIIPYTFEHTNFKYLKKGMSVNLEFDIIGKYIKRHMATRLSD